MAVNCPQSTFRKWCVTKVLCNLSLLKSTPPIFNMGDFLKTSFLSTFLSFSLFDMCLWLMVLGQETSSSATRSIGRGAFWWLQTSFHLPLKDFFISRWKIAETGGKTGNASLLEKITDRQGKVKAKCGIAWMHNMQNVQCTDTGQLHWIICTLWQTKKYIFCRTANTTPHSPKSTGYLVKIQF